MSQDIISTPYMCHKDSPYELKKERYLYILRLLNALSHLVQDIGDLSCIKQSLKLDAYSTTRLQLRTIKVLRAIYDILNKILTKYNYATNYKIKFPLGPMKHYQRQITLEELVYYISSFTLHVREKFKKFTPTEISDARHNMTFYLFRRCVKSLEIYLSVYHHRVCVKCPKEQ